MNKLSQISMHYKNENLKQYLHTTTAGPQYDASNSNFAFQLA